MGTSKRVAAASERSMKKLEKLKEKLRVEKLRRKAPRQIFVVIDGDGNTHAHETKMGEAKTARDILGGGAIVVGPYVLAERVRNG